MSLPRRLTKELLARDYKFVPALSQDNVISEDSGYLTFIKQQGTTLLGVVLIKGEERDTYYRLRDSFFEGVSKAPCSNVYLVGLFRGSKGDEELMSLCTYDIEDYTKRENEVRWLVDEETGDIVVKGNQPDRLLYLREITLAALTGRAVEDTPVEVGELIQNELDSRRKLVKTGNIACTLTLVALNVLLLAITYFTGGIGVDNMTRMGALNTLRFWELGEYYRLITSMFLHYGLVHLASNMVFVYVFGSDIERYYGKLRFLVIYLGSGLAGNLVYLVFTENGVAAGASGAVFGLMGAMLALAGHLKRSVEGKDTYFMLMCAAMGILGGMLMPGVANSAHIGGFIGGIILGRLLYKK